MTDTTTIYIGLMGLVIWMSLMVAIVLRQGDEQERAASFIAGCVQEKSSAECLADLEVRMITNKGG